MHGLQEKERESEDLNLTSPDLIFHGTFTYTLLFRVPRNKTLVGTLLLHA